MIRRIINWFVPVSQGVKELGQQMIENPTEWVQGEFAFTNTKHPDITIWTCNGILFIKISGFAGLSFSDKIYINNCIKLSMARKLNTT